MRAFRWVIPVAGFALVHQPAAAMGSGPHPHVPIGIPSSPVPANSAEDMLLAAVVLAVALSLLAVRLLRPHR